MSNRIYANANKVENLRSGEIYYEVDIFDSYEYGSINISEEEIPQNDMDTLQHLINRPDDSEDIANLLDFMREHKKGITINDTFYDWEEIKHLFPDK